MNTKRWARPCWLHRGDQEGSSSRPARQLNIFAGGADSSQEATNRMGRKDPWHSSFFWGTAANLLWRQIHLRVRGSPLKHL